MTQLEKAIARLRAHAPDSDFNDVRRVLEAHGWIQRRQKGTHVTFKKPGAPGFTIPLTGGNRVKHVYVADVLARLGVEN